MQWDEKFAARTQYMKRSTIREILKLTAQPDVISFAGGLPAPELFPIQRVQEATDMILAERGQESLQYSTSEGMPELRDLIAKRLSDDYLIVKPENIVIVTGSQQALDLIGRVMLDEGDPIIAENPTYLGTLMAWKHYNLRYLPISTDDNGMIVSELEPLLQQQPKMIYAIPNFQNPQGVTMSTERRRALVKLLADYQMPLLEDNPYGELRYSGEAPPSLLSLDAQNLGKRELDGHVMYAGTFSKVLTPGLRVGWVAAPEPLIDKIVQAKQAADLHTSTLAQFITYEVARDGFIDHNLVQLKAVYRERRDVMLNAMAEHFPEGITWSKPDGGLFLMVTLPEGMDATDLLQEAIEHKVAFVPGADFHIDGSGQNTFRLNYSNAKPERIVEGIRRLGALLQARIPVAAP